MLVDLENLLETLDIETLDSHLFRGQILMPDLTHVYGGQVLAQALVACMKTVPEQRRIHSMHAYFLRPGNHRKPIIYDVEPIRDGGSFTTRRVVARQNGKAIFNSSMSFKTREIGLEHQFDMPQVEPPESIEPDFDYWQRLREQYPDARPHFRERLTAIDGRAVNRRELENLEPCEPVQGLWFRADGQLPADSTMHEALVAFASDFAFMGTAFRPHPVSFITEGLQAASLDHAIWFHSEIKSDEWLYYHMDSPRASNATGINRGSIYSQDGMLVASTAQEGLMRLRAS